MVIVQRYMRSPLSISSLGGLSNTAWKPGTGPLDWQSRGGGPSFQKVGPQGVLQLKRLLSLPGELYFKI